MPRLPRQFQRRMVDILLQMGGAVQPRLAAELAELGVPDGQRHAAAVHAVAAQAARHTVGQHRQAGAYLLPAGEIPGKGGAVAHGFYRLGLVLGTDGAAFQPVGVVVELRAVLAQ